MTRQRKGWPYWHLGLGAHYPYRYFTGVGRYSYNVIPALAELDQEHQCVIFKHRDSTAHVVKHPRFRGLNFPIGPVGPGTPIVLGTTLGQQRVELLQPHFAVAPLARSFRSIVTGHDLQPILVPEFSRHRYRQRLGKVGHVTPPELPNSEPSDQKGMQSLLRRMEAARDVAVSYLDASRAGIAKRLFSAVRERFTRHLRVHYLGPLVGKQGAYNRLVYQALCDIEEELEKIRSRLDALEGED